MTKRLKKWEFYGFLFVAALGTLGHFLFDISGGNNLVGKFFPVNESTWEHLKLLFFPYVVFSIIEWFNIGKSYKSFATAKLWGVLAGMLFIVVSFYAYSGVLGKTVDFINILIFFIASALAFFVSYKLLKNVNFNVSLKALPVGIIVLVAVLFVIFTTNPPEINLFKDPVTGEFGVPAVKQ